MLIVVFLLFVANTVLGAVCVAALDFIRPGILEAWGSLGEQGQRPFLELIKILSLQLWPIGLFMFAVGRHNSNPMTPATKAAADRVRARNPEGVSSKKLIVLAAKVEKAIDGLEALVEATEGYRDLPEKVARAQFYLKPAATLLKMDALSLEEEAKAK